jgi:sugar phosphate isomerase/epimerase
MKSCVTISLVPEARGGPFVFWDDLPGACEKAGRLGFDAVEIFAPGPEAINISDLEQLLRKHRLKLAALGTGGGWMRHKLTLTSASAEMRQRGIEFISQMIGVASRFSAAVIIGSMQGRFDAEVSHGRALDYLGAALTELSNRACSQNVTILYEHLNRYETNLLNRIEDVVPFVKPFGGKVKILADLFHMSIEEANIAEAIRAAGEYVGHVHLADSNRRPAGLGHTDFRPIFGALEAIGYNGYISAEAFPFPDPEKAAEQTMKAFRRWVS